MAIVRRRGCGTIVAAFYNLSDAVRLDDPACAAEAPKGLRLAPEATVGHTRYTPHMTLI